MHLAPAPVWPILAAPTAGIQNYADATLCGIGFTISPLIGALAILSRPDLLEEAKIRVLAGSIPSALLGYLILRCAPQNGARRSL